MTQNQAHRIDIESMVDANASTLGLTIDAEHRPGVLVNIERIAQQAQLLMEFALADEIEPAPVFSHAGR